MAKKIKSKGREEYYQIVKLYNIVRDEKGMITNKQTRTLANGDTLDEAYKKAKGE